MSSRTSPATLFLALALLVGVLSLGGTQPVTATPPVPAELALELDGIGIDAAYLSGPWYARFEGVPGESQAQDRDEWVEITSIQWGLGRAISPGSSSRRRATADVADFVVTFEYEKAAPKLQEKTFTGAVIPEVEIELTQPGGGDVAGEAVYLRYELKNVTLTAYEVVGPGGESGRPLVAVSMWMEEMTTTYTEYDPDGPPIGNVETIFDRTRR